jgi:hypothetical protein
MRCSQPYRRALHCMLGSGLVSFARVGDFALWSDATSACIYFGLPRTTFLSSGSSDGLSLDLWILDFSLFVFSLILCLNLLGSLGVFLSVFLSFSVLTCASHPSRCYTILSYITPHPHYLSSSSSLNALLINLYTYIHTHASVPPPRISSFPHPVPCSCLRVK